MNVSFDTIPGSTRVPGRYIEFNTRTATRGLPSNAQKMLLITSMLSTGTHKALTPIQLFSDREAADLFGSGSLAHLCVKQAFTNNGYLDLTVIGVEDAEASIAATGTVTISGLIKSSGVLNLSIAGFTYQASFHSTDSLNAIATRLTDVINQSEALVNASSKDNVITLTAKNKGSIGNGITLSARSTSNDISVICTKMTGGDVNPDIAPALNIVAGKRYQIICSTFSDELNAKKLSNHIEHVSNAIEKRGCIGVLGWRDSLATGTTFASKLNDGRITIAWYKNAKENNALIAAGYAAVLAFEEDPAKPLDTLEVKGLTITDDKDWPLYAEFNSALYNGLSPLHIVSNKVQIMRAISTYTSNQTGTDDPALLDITTIRTLDYVRDAINQRIALRFPREKLSNKTPLRVKSELLNVLMECEDAEILENVQEFRHLLTVVRNPNDPNRLDTIVPADVVNGLHVFAARIDLYL